LPSLACAHAPEKTTSLCSPSRASYLTGQYAHTHGVLRNNEDSAASIPKEIQGRSLVPLLKGNPAGWRTAFLAEYFDPPRYPIPGWQAVRGERWKYIRYTGLPGMDEFYDLKADPHELKNLVADPPVAATLREMKSELERLLKETQAEQHN